MSNKSEITLIAEAIIAEAIITNSRLIELLIAKLPDATKEAVAKEVAKVNPTPAPAPVQAPVVEVAAPPAPVVAPPAPVVAAVPTPAPTPEPEPVVVQPAGVPDGALKKAPFTSQKDMLMYVMGKYTSLGREKGAGIQSVLVSLGIGNINNVDASLYDQLYTGIEAIQ